MLVSGGRRRLDAFSDTIHGHYARRALVQYHFACTSTHTSTRSIRMSFISNRSRTRCRRPGRGYPTPTVTTRNEVAENSPGRSGSDSRRSSSGSPDGVAKAEGGESDGVGLADGGKHEHQRRAAERGRFGEGSESKSSPPPSGTVNGNCNRAGRSLRSRNGPAAAAAPRR
jgi:hypothetical protein